MDNQPNPNDERKTLESELQMVEIIELIWHLIEILYLQTSNGESIVPLYQNWIWSHFQEPLTLTQHLMQKPMPEKDPNFWDTVRIPFKTLRNILIFYQKKVYGLVLQGRIQLVYRLLSSHSHANNFAFKTILHLISIMPEVRLSTT